MRIDCAYLLKSRPLTDDEEAEWRLTGRARCVTCMKDVVTVPSMVDATLLLVVSGECPRWRQGRAVERKP